MTFFKNDNGDIINYGGNDFSMSKQIFSVFDFQIKGDVSTNFTLDNTAEIRSALGFFGINASVDMAKKRIPYTLILNQSEIRGYIVIQDVFILTIKCYFIAGNANWFNSFEFNIREITNLNDFITKNPLIDNSWAQATVTTEWAVTPNDGIIYPFIDIYEGKKNSSIYSSLGIFSDNGFANNNSDNAVFEFYPALYLKNVIDYAFRKAKFKIAGDILNDVKYQNTAITAYSGDMQFDDSLVSVNTVNASFTGPLIIGGGVTTQIPLSFFSGNQTMWNNVAHAPVSSGPYSFIADIEIHTTVSQIYTLSGLFPYVSATVSTVKASISGSLYTLFGKQAGYVFSTIFINGPGVFSISSATITFRMKQSLRVNDIISPLAFLPSLSAMDLIKCAAIRFGCFVSYEESSQTVTFNKMDSAAVEDDWSEFLVDYEYLYQDGFKNNFVRTPQPDEFATYNLTNDAKFGEVNLQTDYDVNMSKDIYEDPFAGAFDAQNNNLTKWCQPRIPFTKFTDGDPIAATIINDGAGFVQLNVASSTGFNQYNVIRLDEITNFYSGLHVITSITPTTIVLATAYSFDSTATLFPQSMNLNACGSRLLLINKNTSIFSIGSSDVSFSGGAALGQTTFGWFSKPTTGRGVDALKPSLSYGRINLVGYDDVPLDNGFATVKNMLNSPLLRATFNLPESKFANFRGGKISLTCKDFTGNFWVHKILNYVDQGTPVKIDLLFA